MQLARRRNVASVDKRVKGAGWLILKPHEVLATDNEFPSVQVWKSIRPAALKINPTRSAPLRQAEAEHVEVRFDLVHSHSEGPAWHPILAANVFVRVSCQQQSD